MQLDATLITGLAKAIAVAHAAYGEKSAVVIFVVQPGETNSIDQRLLELQLWNSAAVPVRCLHST